MILEVGKTYLNRKGEQVLIKQFIKGNCILSVLGEVKNKGLELYSKNGNAKLNSEISKRDLIAEYKPKNEPIFNF